MTGLRVTGWGREGGNRAGCPTIRREHGDRVPVSEPWMPPNGGTRRLQGDGVLLGSAFAKASARLVAVRNSVLAVPGTLAQAI